MDSQRAILCNSHMNSRSTIDLYYEIAGGPHGLCWTHADRVNAEVVPFVE
jgi:hypothetical protein